MCNISNSTGPDSNSETSWEDGDISTPFAGKTFYKDLIHRADKTPIIKVFKHYGLRLDENNRKIICPIPSHKGGRESTASFWYYPQTNTFWCFGCKTGVGCCDFVASMDKITKVSAAFKILELFSSDVPEEVETYQQDFSERFEIMLDFSNTIRDFRQSHFDQKSFDFIENICKVYDAINLKHELNNEALRSVVNKLKTRINSYI
jgi:DNA primase